MEETNDAEDEESGQSVEVSGSGKCKLKDLINGFAHLRVDRIKHTRSEGW